MRQSKREVPAGDFTQAVKDKLAGQDDRLDYDALSPEEKRFLIRLKHDVDHLPPQELEKIEERVEQFIRGEMSLAEFECYPPEFLYELARMGHTFVELNQFDQAETIFKGLSVFDHKNYYYRGMLGVIYQKKQDFVSAIVEYSIAVELNPEDSASYTNRGECWLKLGVESEALVDFEKAIAIGAKHVDKWANRAQILRNKLLEKQKVQEARA